MKIISSSIMMIAFLIGCTTSTNSHLSKNSGLIKQELTSKITPLTFNEYIKHQLKGKKKSSHSSLYLNYKGERDEQHFPLFIDYLAYRAALENIPTAIINQAVEEIYFLKQAIKSDKNQLENKITLNEYLNRVLSDSRHKQAQDNYKKYHPILRNISNKTGVPAQYIIALWGLESAFGKIQGKESVLAAIATLAYDGRRESFFVEQFVDALKVIEKGYITADKMKGSWAGAMGQCQFMPSSLLKYGVDGNNDGLIDIWSNKNDVFASIANYLSTEGWNKNLSWGEPVILPIEFDKTREGIAIEKARTIKEWQKLGIKFKHKKQGIASDQRAWLIIADDNIASAFLVYDNFRTIMHWNRSYYFAISVGMLADSIKLIK